MNRYLVIALTLLTLLTANSCANKIVEFPEVTQYLGEDCYKVKYVDSIMGVEILNSTIIATQRKIGSPTFSYAQYASICALFISRYEIEGVNSIKITITDSLKQANFHYRISDVRKIDKKLKVDYDFGIALKENDYILAKQYFSDSLKQLPDTEINTNIFKKYFGHGTITDDKLVAYTIVGKRVGNFIEYEFDNDKRQTYIFVHELDGHDNIVEIMFVLPPQVPTNPR